MRSSVKPNAKAASIQSAIASLAASRPVFFAYSQKCRLHDKLRSNPHRRLRTKFIREEH